MGAVMTAIQPLQTLLGSLREFLRLQFVALYSTYISCWARGLQRGVYWLECESFNAPGSEKAGQNCLVFFSKAMLYFFSHFRATWACMPGSFHTRPPKTGSYNRGLWPACSILYISIELTALLFALQPRSVSLRTAEAENIAARRTSPPRLRRRRSAFWRVALLVDMLEMLVELILQEILLLSVSVMLHRLPQSNRERLDRTQHFMSVTAPARHTLVIAHAQYAMTCAEPDYNIIILPFFAIIICNTNTNMIYD